MLAAIYFWPSSDNWEVKFSPASKENVVAFGDSLTAGESPESTTNYPYYLSELLKAPITNLGKRGDTTTLALARIDEVIAANPSVVIVTLGGNDIIRQLQDEETLKSLTEIFKRLHEKEIMIAYVAIDPPYVRKRRLEKIRTLCREFGVLYVRDALSDLWLDKKYMLDQIHPNNLGNEIMAQKIYAKIKNFVR